MFRISIAPPNPFYDPDKDYPSKDFFYREPRLTKHKALNVQISRWEPFRLFEFDLDISLWGRDHAGIEFDFFIYGYGINLNLYDIRHWDTERNDWEDPNNPIQWEPISD